MRPLLAGLAVPLALIGCSVPDVPTADVFIQTDAHYLGVESIRNVRIDGRAHDIRLSYFPFSYEWYGIRAGSYTITYEVGDETVEMVLERGRSRGGVFLKSSFDHETYGSARVLEGPRLVSPKGRPALRVNILRAGKMINAVDVRLDGVKADEFEEDVCPVWTWSDLEPGKYSLTVETISGTVYDQTIEVLESGGALIYGVDLVSADKDRVIVIDDAVRIDPPFDFDKEDGDVPGVPDYVRLWVP